MAVFGTALACLLAVGRGAADPAALRPRVGETRHGVARGSLTAFFDVGFGLGGPVIGARLTLRPAATASAFRS